MIPQCSPSRAQEQFSGNSNKTLSSQSLQLLSQFPHIVHSFVHSPFYPFYLGEGGQSIEGVEKGKLKGGARGGGGGSKKEDHIVFRCTL